VSAAAANARLERKARREEVYETAALTLLRRIDLILGTPGDCEIAGGRSIRGDRAGHIRAANARPVEA
jgi:hypothetical protein